MRSSKTSLPQTRREEGAVVRRRPWGAGRIGLALLGLIVLALAGLWLQRGPIAGYVLENELRKRGVTASYRVARIGLRRERLEDLVIGDPRRPDLTAKSAEVIVSLRWGGVTVHKIVAREVRLRGRIEGGKLHLGEVDKLLPPPSGKPFAFPDFELDLRRGLIALQTPAGPIGLAIEGRGRVSDGFRGRLAASAPALDLGRCTLKAAKAGVSVAIRRRSPTLDGPISAERIDCGDFRALRPLVDARVTLPERFDSWRGVAKVRMAAASAGGARLARLAGTADFAGNGEATGGTTAVRAANGDIDGHRMGPTSFEGKFRIAPGAGRYAAHGTFAASRVALAGGTLEPVTRALRSSAGTPLAPLGLAAADRLDRLGRSMSLEGELGIVQRRGYGGARIASLAGRSASGARFSLAGGDGLTLYWPGGMRLAGDAALSGGGLPDIRLSLDQRLAGGPISGTARIAPYRAGGASLALAPVRFALAPGGATRVDTVATLSGPIEGGRIDGLVVPVSGSFGGGAFRFGEGCVTVHWASVQYRNLRLGRTSLPLCPTGGALVSGRRGRVDLAATLTPRFAGVYEGRPFAFTAAPTRFALGQRQFTGSDVRLRWGPYTASAPTARFSLDGQRLSASGVRLNWGAIAATAATLDAPLAQRRFAARDVALIIGEAPSQTLVDLDALNGKFRGSEFTGTFGGGRGRVGRVPLVMSEAAGRWSYRRNVLAAEGGLIVSDDNPNPRFYPLVSRDARLTLADNRVAADAEFRDPETGTHVTDLAIRHDLDAGTGRAGLAVPGIRFTESFQPEALTRLTTGIVALVEGIVRGEGEIRWDRQGVMSSGAFSTDDLDLAAAFGPVRGLKGTVSFSDLLGLATAPGQSLDIAEIDAGILVQDGRLRYQLLPGQRVRVEEGRWPYAGGELILEETVLDFSRASAKRLTFRVQGLDAARFVQQMAFSNISATGTFDGIIPMIFDAGGGRIVGGKLVARPEGGTLSYIGELTDKQLGVYGKLAFDALKSLRYNKLAINLDGSLSGEFLAAIELDGIARDPLLTTTPSGSGIRGLIAGRALGQLAKIPFEFNINVRGPFRTLLATTRSLENPTDLLQSVLPDLLREQPVAPPIQPEESEPVR